jgi:type II secretory pathway pseudopilin PulG
LKGDNVKRKSFTLVELLVAIAIVVLCVLFLMPALSRVTKFEQEERCELNLDSLVKAMERCANDHNGKYPPADK